MTDDEQERERAELLDAIGSGRPLTPDEEERIKAIAKADAARPLDPWAQALGEVLAESVAMLDRDPAVGLTVRPGPGRSIEAMAGGVVFATISAAVVEARAAEIRVERGE